MEKIVCALWKPSSQSREAFNAALFEKLPPALGASGATHLQINVRDAEVEPAAGLVQQWQQPQQDAVVQFWLPSANARFRGAIDRALSESCERFAAWLVAESTIIPNTRHLAPTGTRTPGWSQASFISFRADLSREAAIAHWHTTHTRVAIETQANFEYVQNLVVLALTEGAPPYDAFVEECFPDSAMTNPQAFFDAVGNPEKFDANLRAMTQSCEAFIDFARIDIIPTSQFRFGA